MSADELTHCCEQPLQWDPEAIGRTCGGLEVRGALWCGVCQAQYIGDDTHEREAWSVVRGGRSVDTGRGRVRVDGATDSAEELIRRIARLPELEALERRLERRVREAKA